MVPANLSCIKLIWIGISYHLTPLKCIGASMPNLEKWQMWLPKKDCGSYFSAFTCSLLFLVNWKIYNLYPSAVRYTCSLYKFDMTAFWITIDIPIMTFSACMRHHFEVVCFISSGKHVELEILILHIYQRIQALNAVG